MKKLMMVMAYFDTGKANIMSFYFGEKRLNTGKNAFKNTSV